jgi:hypothetical protein
MKRLAIVILVATVGCATESAALRASDSPYNGPGAGAYYEIVSGNRIIGDVKVWSNGAHEVDGHVVVELGLRVRNNVDTPITVDPSGCGLEVTKAKETLVVDAEKDVSTTEIPAGQMVRVTMSYTLPDKTDIDDIQGLDFYWRLIHDGDAFTRSTTFQQVQRYNSGAYYSPYFYGGPWGPYWGFGGGFGGTYYRPPAGPPPMRAVPPRR